MKETKNNSSPKRYKKETQSQIIRDPKLKSKFKIYALQSPVIFGMIFFNIWFDPYNSNFTSRPFKLVGLHILNLYGWFHFD